MTTEQCPTCGRPFPEGLTWKYVRQMSNGTWEASCRLGRYAGWAAHRETEAEAREKALARLHYAKDWL